MITVWYSSQTNFKRLSAAAGYGCLFVAKSISENIYIQ